MKISQADSIRKEMEDVSRRLDTELAEIHAEAANKAKEAVRLATRRRDELADRLIQLALRQFVSPFGAFSEMREDDQGVHRKAGEKRSARKITMDVLAASPTPVPSNVIDQAVMEEGWSKAAAEKIRTKIRAAGLATSENRLWTLTKKGRAAVSATE